MNREQKRKYTKKLKEKGYSKDDIDKFLLIKDMYENKKFLQEGQKVKLNIKRIKSYPDYDKNMDTNKARYQQWVNDNADKVFTVEYDKKYKENPTMVCLAEDETDPKWLFWEGDLEVVEESE